MAHLDMDFFMLDRALQLYVIEPVINPNINTISTSRHPIRQTNPMNLHHLSNPQQHTNEHERTGPPAVCSTDWIKTKCRV